jgi:hypothetical protein
MIICLSTAFISPGRSGPSVQLRFVVVDLNVVLALPTCTIGDVDTKPPVALEAVEAWFQSHGLREPVRVQTARQQRAGDEE